MGENGSRDIWIGNEGQQMFCQSIRKMGGKFFFTYQVSTFPTVIYNQVPLFCNAITTSLPLIYRTLFVCVRAKSRPRTMRRRAEPRLLNLLHVCMYVACRCFHSSLQAYIDISLTSQNLNSRGKSLLESRGATFLPDWQPTSIFVWFASKSQITSHAFRAHAQEVWDKSDKD